MSASHQIVAGFMPLLDSAILVAAKEKGFAETEGIDLVLARETSWANIRDRMAVGHFQVAHVLAPMPIASNLGLTPLRRADHRADGARPRRQCRHGLECAVGADARPRRNAGFQSGNDGRGAQAGRGRPCGPLESRPALCGGASLLRP